MPRWVNNRASRKRGASGPARSSQSSDNPLKDRVAAVSCGVYKGVTVLDLDYDEDSAAETDANFVITGKGGLVEIQMTAENETFDEKQLAEMLALAKKGIAGLADLQQGAVA